MKSRPSERDLAYIAQVARWFRAQRGITQEALAEIACLTSRVIQKMEEGQPVSEESLRRVAHASGGDVSMFRRPTPEEEARLIADSKKILRTSLLVPMHPIRTAKDILDIGVCHMLRTDLSAVEDDEVLDTGAEIIESFNDWLDIRNDLPMTQQLNWARQTASLCEELGEHGYVCQIGHHRQVMHVSKQQVRHFLRAPDLPTQTEIVFDVTVISVQPKRDSNAPHHALVVLEEPWEVHPDDRPRGNAIADQLDALLAELRPARGESLNGERHQPEN